MINQLIIQNYQSHRKSELNFDPGVNIIIGDSDSGKSAVIRAIKQVFYNKPGGDDYRSWWGGDTEITIKTDDDQEVKRVKTNSENLYYLNDTRFAAFGSDIPEEIKQALNINDTNLQNQLDAPFLLSKTPGEVAIFLNKIAHIDKIHTTTSLINSWIKEINSNIKADNNSIELKQIALERLPDITKLEIDIEVIEDAQSRKQALTQNKSKLTAILNQIQLINNKIEGVNRLINLQDLIDKIMILYSEKKERETYFKSLAFTLDSIKSIKKKVENIGKLIELNIPLKNAITLIDDKKEKQDKYNQLSRIISSINALQASIKINQSDIKEFQDELIKATPDICPFCGTNLKQNKNGG